MERWGRVLLGQGFGEGCHSFIHLPIPPSILHPSFHLSVHPSVHPPSTIHCTSIQLFIRVSIPPSVLPLSVLRPSVLHLPSVHPPSILHFSSVHRSYSHPPSVAPIHPTGRRGVGLVQEGVLAPVGAVRAAATLPSLTAPWVLVNKLRRYSQVVNVLRGKGNGVT